jgi:hypothetical protein
MLYYSGSLSIHITVRIDSILNLQKQLAAAVVSGFTNSGPSVYYTVHNHVLKCRPYWLAKLKES